MGISKVQGIRIQRFLEQTALQGEVAITAGGDALAPIPKGKTRIFAP